MFASDTIFAQATPPGRSGVAVIRISGAEARKALSHFSIEKHPTPRQALFRSFRLGNDVIDRGLVLFFPGPNSFTGEDVIEFQLHGGVAILRRILSELGTLSGFRLAEPGEFARRAFLNEKLDLTAAEGLADLIDAETEMQRQQAMKMMEGRAAHFVEELRENIIRCQALLEAYIDFPDEDIPESTQRELDETVQLMVDRISRQLDDNHYGERLRDGFTVILVGPPNAGKSSLLNALAKRDVAIVSEVAGTTRDMLEVHLDIRGYPVTLIDTAGLRESSDKIESEGVRRALERAANADITLYCHDASLPFTADQLMGFKASKHPLLLLRTKSDEKGNQEQERLTKTLPGDGKDGKIMDGELQVSSKTGYGITDLIDQIGTLLADQTPSGSITVITRERHRIHLVEVVHQLSTFLQSPHMPIEIRSEYLRLAGVECGRITGRIDVEDILDVIFSSFCIGK